MEVKNGIIIDGVLHELKPSNAKGCKRCSLYGLCYEDFGDNALCNILLESDEIMESPMFFSRGKVKVEREEE